MTEGRFYKQDTVPDILAKEKESVLPERIGPYKIEALLNQGGMSLLYLGIDSQTKQPLAVKVLSPQLAPRPEMTQQFMKEAAFIKMANHPNIVKLYGQGEWEGGVYLAMELVRGISLRQFILQHSLSLRRSVDILLQVAYALCHLHTHGVIHGDLKPENILIEEDGEIKVVDFGIARFFGEELSPESKAVAGTPNYMSPEYKESPKNLTYVSDIYSLGVIAYELILGRLSFGIINLSLIPRGLRRIVGKCLAVSVQERYLDIVDFITDLSLYLKSGEIDKDKPGSDELKEVIETVSKAAHLQIPLESPDWSTADIGIAKSFPPMSLNLYQDFFRFPNNAMLVILASAATPWVEGSFSAAFLSGICKSLVASYTEAKHFSFQLLDFVKKLNALLHTQKVVRHYKVNFLYLDPKQEMLSFIPCDSSELLHIASGTRIVRKLGMINAALGAASLDAFTVTTDNWNVGDKLIIHNIELPTKDRDLIEKAFVDNLFFSAQRQAEVVLKKVATHPSQSKNAKMLLSIQRIS